MFERVLVSWFVKTKKKHKNCEREQIKYHKTFKKKMFKNLLNKFNIHNIHTKMLVMFSVLLISQLVLQGIITVTLQVVF